MKKSVGRITMRMAIFAIALTWAGSASSASAATTAQVLAALYPSNTSYTLLAPNESASFIKTGDIVFNVLESTTGTSFGFVRGGPDQILTHQQPRQPGPGFDAYALTTGANTELVANGTNPLGRFQGSNSDFETPGIINGSATTIRGNLAIGSSPFSFVLRTGTTFSNPGTPTNATLSDNPADRFTSTSPGTTFKAYAINSGEIAGGYILSFEGKDANNQDFTFVAAVTGVVNPEPASMAMLGMGVIGLVGYRARRRLKAAAAV